MTRMIYTNREERISIPILFSLKKKTRITLGVFVLCSLFSARVNALPLERKYALDVVEKTEETNEHENVKTRPIPEEEWTPEARLWLARSVLGEAGWQRWDEYTAIAYVYAERSKASRAHDFTRMIKKYSAAVRRPGKRRNPWLFQTKTGAEALTRPPLWPMGPQWKGLHDRAWARTLQWADEWYEGKRANPCPGANHFGGRMDAHRAENKRWLRIQCKPRMRNRFYTSLRLAPKPDPRAYRKRLLRL